MMSRSACDFDSGTSGLMRPNAVTIRPWRLSIGPCRDRNGQADVGM